MTRPRRLLAALLTALAGCLVLTAQAGASVPAGGGFGGQLTGVSCVTAGDCWAVGGTQTNVALADHWNGSTWSVVRLPAPRQAHSTELPAISCSGVASCWAVGDYESVTTSKLLPYAVHWNGSAWSVVLLPHPAGAFVTTPVAVSCSGAASCWAVGTAGSPAAPLLERWNGQVWAMARAPAISAQADPLGVFCASAADCWVTGQNAKGGTLAAHWNGSTWSVTPAPTSGPTGDYLAYIACGGRDCVAVGGTSSRTLAERWDGSAWTVAPTGNAYARFGGLSCTARLHCVATGNTIGGRAFSEVWNGSAWRIVWPQVPAGFAASGLAGVSCVTAADCWSVGNKFDGVNITSLIEHWNGTAWSIVP